jgi:hypothetical protein
VAPKQGPEQRLKVRKALEVHANIISVSFSRIRSNIDREMGQQESKERVLFTESLCSVL